MPQFLQNHRWSFNLKFTLWLSICAQNIYLFFSFLLIKTINLIIAIIYFYYLLCSGMVFSTNGTLIFNSNVYLITTTNESIDNINPQYHSLSKYGHKLL